jgi:AcrR family transcriptional regulator
MPKATRSEEEVEVVREQILDHALEILAKDGYENLSMGKLGSRMNMTAANLYNYYANKDELLIAIHKKTFAMLNEQMRKAVKSAGTPKERVIKLANTFTEFGTENINIYDIMFNRPIPQYSDYIGTPQEELAYEEYQNSFKALAFAIMVVRDYAETRPELQSVDPKFLTIKIFSTLHGIVSLHNSGILYEMDDDPDQMLRDVIDDAICSVTG